MLLLFFVMAVSSYLLIDTQKHSTEENIKLVENYTKNIVEQSKKEGNLIWDKENITTDGNYYTGFMIYALLTFLLWGIDLF